MHWFRLLGHLTLLVIIHNLSEYIDVGISGTKEKHPELDRLMQDAYKQRFDAVLVYCYDRFARSLRHLVNALEEFRALGIDFVSLHEGVDNSTPNGRLCIRHFRLDRGV